MSTRTARFNDHWRRALARDYPVQYSSFSFKGLRCLQDGVITFAKGITAIVGGNGVGKSTLAQAIVDVLAGVDGVHDLSHLGLRLIGSELHANIVNGNGVRELSLLICPNGDRKGGGSPLLGEFTWLDSSNMAVLCQRQIHNDPAFDDLLESIGPRNFDEHQLRFASYIVGKDYTQCTVWEIQDYQSFDVFPYFRVTCGGTTYGSEDMGLGEFALFLSLWTLNRVAINSIVVLEEPETHISSRSQNALMDLVAWACDHRGLWVVITTHSPVVLQKIPKENIRLLVSNGTKSKVVSAPHLHQIASIVGGGVAYRNLLLVEDEFAGHFAQGLLEQLEIDLKQQTVFAVMKGHSQITTILCTLPPIDKWSKVVGVYDGDMQGKAES